MKTYFECVDGPLKGNSLFCEFEPYHLARKRVLIQVGEMNQEVIYELRREGIVNDTPWQWHCLNAAPGNN